MSLRGIRIYGDPVLGSRAEEVSTFDRGLRILANDMLETMDEAGGVGLAANQVGILKRIFVYDCSHTQSGLRGAIVNPVWTPLGAQQQIGPEGCLSIPGKQGTVKRAKNIKVKYNDLTGEEKIMEAEDFLARIIQHEMDHLDGILYTDKAIEMYEAKDEED